MKQNIKHISVFMIILLLIGISTSMTCSAAVNGLGITTMEVTPQPAEPGNDVTLKIRVSNQGVESIEDFSLKIDVQYPFYLKSESKNFENKRILNVGSSVDNTYYLTVDPNATSGIYPVKFDVHVNNVILNPSDNNVYIQIIGKPDLTVKADTIGEISPGDTFPLQLSVSNIGTGMANNIKISSESENILMLGSNVELINRIMPAETSQVKFDLIVRNDLKPDAYQFPVKLQYIDEMGDNYTLTYNVGLDILNSAELGIQSIKITPTQVTSLDLVHIVGIIENTGNGDAKQVIVNLVTEEGEYRSFIGQLKTDDDAPFYFDIKPGSAGEKNFNLSISYTDDFGSHEIEQTIPLQVSRPKTNVLMAIALIVIIALPVAYFIIRKRRNENGQK
ncbi:MAG: S-layer protein [Methanolobus sp.]|nr:S-layer protein [Methanolobus sp.]